MSDRRQFWCRHLNLALFALFAGLLTLVLLLPCRVTAAAPEVGNPILATRAAGKYWAFQPIRSPEAPSTKQQNWVRNPIDAFILHQLESNHLAPAPPADRRTLIRRVYFDLLGVPPTPDQVAQFIHDPDPKAYEHLVDRLLQSPQYGERWAGIGWMSCAMPTARDLRRISSMTMPGNTGITSSDRSRQTSRSIVSSRSKSRGMSCRPTIRMR